METNDMKPEGIVPCTELVAELEAALATAEKMMKQTERREGSTYYYWQGRYDEAESAMDRVRCHSATGAHQRESAAQPRNASSQ